MRKTLLVFLTALFVGTTANAAYIKLAGTAINELNYQDIKGDGSASYDPSTNTLTLDNFSYKPLYDANPFIEVSETGTGISVTPDNKALTIKCLNKSIVSTITSSPSIEYSGRVFVTGSGVLSISNDGTAIKCKRLSVTDGSVLTLKSAGSSTTLIADTLDTEYSVLNVIAAEKASVGINSDMNMAYWKGTWSEHDLMQWSETERKKIRYKCRYRASQHMWDYCNKYETNTTWYKGWYHFSSAGSKVLSTDVDIYPEVYPILVNGVQVDRYNYLNVLNDGTVSYDPLTKTLTVKKDVDVEHEGYLVIDNTTTNNKTEKNNTETNPNINLENTIAVAPSYVNEFDEYRNTGTSPSISFDYINGYYNVEGSGEIVFDSLVSGHIYYNDETRTLTFDNAVLNNTALTIMRGDQTTIELIGDNQFNIDYIEDITLYYVDVVVKGTGSLTANQIYDVRCDSLTIEGGCTVNLNCSHGWGVLTVDNSTVNFDGNEISTLSGYPEVRLINCEIATPDSATYYTYAKPISADYIDRYGYLVKSESKAVVTGMASIVPLSSASPKLKNDVEFDPNAPKYDIQGRRVGSGYKGIYVQGGKKFKETR